MESMNQHGVLPEVGNYTILINKLLHDGDIDAAQHVYDVDMPEAGIEPNDKTMDTMARAEELSIMGQGAQFKLKKKTDNTLTLT